MDLEGNKENMRFQITLACLKGRWKTTDKRKGIHKKVTKSGV